MHCSYNRAHYSPCMLGSIPFLISKCEEFGSKAGNNFCIILLYAGGTLRERSDEAKVSAPSVLIPSSPQDGWPCKWVAAGLHQSGLGPQHTEVPWKGTSLWTFHGLVRPQDACYVGRLLLASPWAALSHLPCGRPASQCPMADPKRPSDHDLSVLMQISLYCPFELGGPTASGAQCDVRDRILIFYGFVEEQPTNHRLKLSLHFVSWIDELLMSGAFKL